MHPMPVRWPERRCRRTVRFVPRNPSHIRRVVDSQGFSSCRTAVLVALIPLVGLILAACGGGDSERPEADRPASTTPSKPTSTATQPSTTESPTVPEPEDGTDLSACLDRTCEVQVVVGDIIRFDPQFRMNEVHVLGVSNNRFEFKAFDDQPTPASGWIGGTGSADIADVHLELVHLDADGAILRFQPR